jgi:hypothetical protein
MLLALPAAAFAQTSADTIVAPSAMCRGEMISSVEIYSHPPGSALVSDVWKDVTHRAPTNRRVIEAYLRVHAGHRCRELERSESERLLRAQRFIAAATVRAVHVGQDSVKIVVNTVDDFAPILGGSTSNGSVSSIQVGTENLNGMGTTVELSAERGFQFRSGYGGDIVQYGAFGHPYTLAIGGDLHPQGDALRFEFAKPFLTDQQPNGFHFGAAEVNGFYDLTRPVGQDVFIDVKRAGYDAGFGVRLGPINTRGTVIVLGAMVMGEAVNTAAHGVFMTDTALVPAPSLPEIDNRYVPMTVLRVGVIAGIRALKFRVVRGFDAITGEQDIGIGTQFGLFAGPSIMSSPSGGDYFMSGDFYAGMGGPQSLLEMRLLGEARADKQDQRWDGVVGFGKFVWYFKPSLEETRIATVELSEVQHLAFPLQLSFFDHVGGLWGFPNAPTVGGSRAILRMEERHTMRFITQRADWAMAVFANAGKIWAGDVPFGETSPVRAAVGVSLLASYPAGGKRTYRVDFAVPINPDGAKFELRFSAGDDTHSIWRQPNDIGVAHSTATLSNFGSWTPAK